MSDIAGQDIEAHGGDARRLIDRVRAFLNSAKRGAPLPSGAVIGSDYDRLGENMHVICQRLEIDAGALEFKDFTWVVTDFLAVGDGAQRNASEISALARCDVLQNCLIFQERLSSLVLCGMTRSPLLSRPPFTYDNRYGRFET